jgi:hypothetical protein
MTDQLHTCPPGPACHSQPGCADVACPGHPGRARNIKIEVLLITGCSDPMRWYARHVGTYVPYLGQTMSDGWASQERAGFRNYVLAQDAKRVRVLVPEDLAEQWPYAHGARIERVKHALGRVTLGPERGRGDAPKHQAEPRPAAGQSRGHSALEAGTNLVVGFAISVGITAVVMPAFGHHVTLGENLAITGIFTVASLLRSYALRRAFNRWAS